MTFTVSVQLTCILYCDAGPGYDQNCLQVQQINYFHGYLICPPTFFFGDATALLRDSYALVQRHSYLSFLQLSDRAYVSAAQCLSFFLLDSSSTTGFEFNSLRASLLTVLRVVYATVRLSSGKTMVSILHVDLISCRQFLRYSVRLKLPAQLVHMRECETFCCLA